MLQADKTEVFQFVLSPAEKRALAELAAHDGRSQASMLRRLLALEAERRGRPIARSDRVYEGARR